MLTFAKLLAVTYAMLWPIVGLVTLVIVASNIEAYTERTRRSNIITATKLVKDIVLTITFIAFGLYAINVIGRM